jgi:hypothetical protein
MSLYSSDSRRTRQNSLKHQGIAALSTAYVVFVEKFEFLAS